jgi:AcrR family transcriptional regulator
LTAAVATLIISNGNEEQPKSGTNMTRGRIRGDHEVKRKEIAEAVYKVILRLGLSETSLADIAREMGYTTGVLRHYFSDKEELLLYAKNYLFDGLEVRSRAAAEPLRGVDKLRAMAMEMLVLAPGGVELYRLLAAFNGYALGNSRLMQLQHKRNKKSWAQFADLISELQHEGSLRKDMKAELEACGLLAMLDGLADQVVMSPNYWTYDDLRAILNRYIDCRFVGLESTPGKSPKTRVR